MNRSHYMEFNPILKLLKDFAVCMCNGKQDWAMTKFVDNELERRNVLVEEKGQVLGAVSGGVHSTVAAKLILEVIGDRSVSSGVSRSKRLLQNTWALISLLLMLLSYFLKAQRDYR